MSISNNRGTGKVRSENVRKAMILAAFGVVTLSSVVAKAQTTYSFGPTGSSNYTGNWTTATDWNPVGTPGINDTATVNSGNTLQVAAADTVFANKLQIATGTNTTGTFSIAGSVTLAAQTINGTYTAPSFLMGSGNTSTSTGTILAGGSLTIRDLNANVGLGTLGNNNSSTATLVVNGTLLYDMNTNGASGSGRGFVIGRSGTGILTINSGGSADFRAQKTDTQLEMGYNQGGTGILNMNGGTLLANFVNVRNTANASNPVNASVTLNFAGGTSTFSSTANMVAGNPGLVTVNISGGQLNLSSPLRPSASALAGVNWSGGTLRLLTATATTFPDAFNFAGGGTGAIVDTSGPIATPTGMTATFSGNSSGTGSLTKTGTGQLTISGIASFSGGVTVNQGTLLLSNAGNTLSGGVRLNGGTLQIGGSGTPLGANTNTLTLAGGTLASSGTGGVAVATSVSVTGNVNIGNATQSGRVQFGSPVNLNGGTWTFTGTGVGTNGRIIDFNSGSIFNGTLVLASSTSTPTTVGNERFRVGGATVTGGLTVNSGTLFLGTSGAIGFNGNVTVNSPGVFDLNDSGAVRSPNIGSLNGSGTLANTNAPNSNLLTAILNIGGTSQTGTFSGLLVDNVSLRATIGLNVQNGQTQTLTNPANAFVGPVIVSANSTLRTPILTNAGLASPIGAASTANSLLLSGGTLQYYGDAVSTNRSFSLTSAGGAIDASGSTSAGTGALNFTSTAAVSFDETYAHTFTWAAGANNFTSQETYGIAVGQLISGPGITPGTTITQASGGTIALSGNTTLASTNGTYTFVNPTTNDRTFTLTGVNTANNTFSPLLTDTPYGRVALTKNGVGTWILNNNETYTGPTTINAGILRLASTASLSSASSVTVNTGGTFDPSAAYPSGFPVVAGQTLTYNGTVTGNVVNNGVVANTSAVNNTIGSSFSGSGSFIKSAGTGTATFTGAANFPSGFTVSAGTVAFASSASLSSPAVSVFSNGTLDVSSLPGGLQVASGNTVVMNGSIVGSIASNGFVDVTTNANKTYPASISGTGILRKYDGTGVATFSSTVNLAGGVNVSAGTAVFTRPLGPVTGSLVVTGPGAITLDPTSYATNSFTSPGTVSSISLGSNGQSGVSSLSIASTNRSANKSSVLVTSGVTLASGATAGSYSGFLDIGNNDLIIKGGAASIETLRSYVRAWLAAPGTGLGSSVASQYTTLALFVNNSGDNVNPAFTSYDGISGLDVNDVIVKFTYIGDTNLDGVLDGQDYKAINEAALFGGTGWTSGDSNATAGGVVGADDIAAFNTAYNYFTTAASPTNYGGATSESGGTSSIPEPSSCGVVLTASLACLGRRRRTAR